MHCCASSAAKEEALIPWTRDPFGRLQSHEKSNLRWTTDLSSSCQQGSDRRVVAAIPTERNSVGSQSPKRLRNVGTLLKTMRKFGDFQAEYIPAVISNGYHQRMSVSVVASPGFEPVAHSGPAELGERRILARSVWCNTRADRILRTALRDLKF